MAEEEQPQKKDEETTEDSNRTGTYNLGRNDNGSPTTGGGDSPATSSTTTQTAEQTTETAGNGNPAGGGSNNGSPTSGGNSGNSSKPPKSKLKTGANATTALRGIGSITGALANTMDAMRKFNKVGLNMGNDAFGTGTMTGMANLTDDAMKNTKAAVDDFSNVVESRKKDMKAINSAATKIPDINDQLAKMKNDAVEKIGQGKKFEELTPDQRRQVLAEYETNVDKFLTDRVGDYKKLDKNSAEAKAVGDSFREMRDADKFASRETRIEDREDKLGLKKRKQKIMNNIQTNIKDPQNAEKKAILQKGFDLLNDPNISLEQEQLYSMAFDALGSDFAAYIDDTTGRFTDDANKKILSKGWSRISSMPDGPEKDAMRDMLRSQTRERMDLSDDKIDFTKDEMGQRYMDSFNSLDEFIKFETRQNKNDLDATASANEDIANFGMSKNPNHIKIAQKYLEHKRKELVDANGRDLYALAESDPTQLTPAELQRVNAYKFDATKVTIAKTRAKVDSALNDVLDTKVSADPNDPETYEKVAEHFNPQTGQREQYNRRTIARKIFKEVTEEEKAKIKADIDKELRDVYMAAEAMYNAGQDPSILTNTAIKDVYEDVYGRAIAKVLQRDIGNFDFHEPGSRDTLTQSEITNLALDDILREIRNQSAQPNPQSGGQSNPQQGGQSNKQTNTRSPRASNKQRGLPDVDTLGKKGAVLFHRRGFTIRGKRKTLESMDANDFNTMQNDMDSYLQSNKITLDKKGDLPANTPPEVRKTYAKMVARKERAVMGKMFAAVASDLSIPENTRRLAQQALSAIDDGYYRNGKFKPLTNSGSRAVRSALSEISKIDGFEDKMNASIVGYDPNNASYLPSPRIAGSGGNGPGSRAPASWAQSVRVLVNRAHY